MSRGFIYLDNAATSWPKPPSVAAAMTDFLATKAGNPGRGGHYLANAAAETIEQARTRLATLVHADTPQRMILTHGCTDSINIAIQGIVRGGLCRGRSEKPHVVASAVEHNAVLRTIHAYSCEGLIDFDIARCGSDGLIDPDEFLSLCNSRTVLACLSHASNVLGTIEPVEQVGSQLREHAPGALFLVDAAQTAGHVPIDVQAWSIDLLALAGHKGLLGPTGTGGLYVGPRAFPDEPTAPRLHCERRGGTGKIAPGLFMPEDLPDALEAGTMNAVGFAGLAAGIDAIPTLDHEKEKRHVARLVEGLGQIPGVVRYGLMTAENRTPSIAFNIADLPARELAARLDEEFRICIRGGVHCAPVLHETIGTGQRGAARVSPSAFNEDAEIDQFLEAIAAIAG